jgi:hypothetical protein
MFFEFTQNWKGNLGIWENLFWELVPYVQVSSNLVPHNSRIKFWKEIFNFFASPVRYRTYPVPVLDSSNVLPNSRAIYRTSPVRYW